MASHDEAGRRFLQRRIALLGRSGSLFIASFLVAFNVVNFLNPRLSWADWLSNRSNQLHLAAAAVMAGIWLACRRGQRSERFLASADAGGFWLACLSFTLSVWTADPHGHRNYAMLLELTNAMLVRTVIVPSSGRRTFWICAALVPPATHAAYLFEARRALPASDVIRHTLEAAVFCSMAVAVATTASHVIYGLRRKVREAQTVGQYTLEKKLGAGAMGVVYRASHALLRRPTAVKLLPPDKSGEAERRRFEREVQLTSTLTHPNTVAIYDYGRTPDGVFYYAMEYLDGMDLENLVRRFGPQPPARVIHVLTQICASLGEAHAAGLVHRDVKPANVILCERWGAADVAKVVDFGLVKDFDGQGDANSTAERVIAGTPGYMAPEAILDRVEPRSDLYAVGALGYFLLTGRNVFEADTINEVLRHHLATPVVPPSQRVCIPIPADLDALIVTCLAKEATGRPASARALQEALESCAGTGTWSQADAREWWLRHGSSKPATSPARDIPTEATELLPLRVDLGGREGTTVERIET